MSGFSEFYNDNFHLCKYELAKRAWNDRQQRIEQLENKLKEIGTSIDAFFDEQVGTPTPREYSNFIADLGKASRGEHD